MLRRWARVYRLWATSAWLLEPLVWTAWDEDAWAAMER